MIETMPLKRISGTCKDHDQVIAANCQECAVGCGLLVYVKDDRIVDIQGAEQHPVSRGRLCAKGMAFVQGLTAPERITLPGTRNRLSGPFEAFDNWEKGIDLLAERLRRVKDQHGAESLVIGCDPEAGLDFFLGAQRFARLWGTPHVYHPLLEPPDSPLPHYRRQAAIPCTQWSRSRCIVLIEADLASSHPVAFGRVLEAQRQGAAVVAMDTRFTTTLSKADRAMIIRPSRGNELGLALMKMLLEEKMVTARAVQSDFQDAQAWQDSFASLPLDGIDAALGVHPEEIRGVARLLGQRQPAILITGQHLAFEPYYPIWLTMAQAMDWTAATGGGWYPIESAAPQLDPVGDLPATAAAAPQALAGPHPGRRNGRWEEAMRNTNVKALVGSGNCLIDFLSPLQPLAASMDLLVYFGNFPNRTREMAHMVFPATHWAERDALSFTNDGAVQWSRKIVKPSDACRTGLGFWMRLAQRLGWEKFFPWKKANGLADQRSFYEWLFQRSPQTADLKMEMIEQGHTMVFWNPPVEPALHSRVTPLPAPAAIAVPTPMAAEDAYPLSFQSACAGTGSSDAGRWWPWQRELESERSVQIHPRVAQALEIENGESVLVASSEESLEGQARITRMVPPRLVWSSQRMNADRVLVYRKGQSPEEARDRLKAMGL